MPMHFGCFDECKTKKVSCWEREREWDTETERMTARSPHMITKISSTGHLLKMKALFSLRQCDSYHSLCLCQVYKEKIQYCFNQPLRPEQKANESCSLSSRAAPVTSSLGSRAAYCKWGRHPGIPAHLTSDWQCGLSALLLKNNNTSQQLPGVIYLNSTGDNSKWISSYFSMFPALFFISFLIFSPSSLFNAINSQYFKNRISNFILCV